MHRAVMTRWDLCAGPHVENTADINIDAVELESVAGAYWRGDETRAMLQRVYGTAWESPEQLKVRLNAGHLLVVFSWCRALQAGQPMGNAPEQLSHGVEELVQVGQGDVAGSRDTCIVYLSIPV
jgi:hypothetical protein